MKTILILTLMIFSQISFARTLTCGELYPTKKDFTEGNDATFRTVFDYLEARCVDGKKNEYRVRFKGVGLNPRLGAIGVTSISCPFLKKKKKIIGTYRGVKLGLTMVGGAHAGLFVGKKAKTCFMAGLEAGLGATVVVEKMEIKDYWEAYNYEGDAIVVE